MPFKIAKEYANTGIILNHWECNIQFTDWTFPAIRLTMSGWPSLVERQAGKQPLQNIEVAFAKENFPFQPSDFANIFQILATKLTESRKDEDGKELNEWHGAVYEP